MNLDLNQLLATGAMTGPHRRTKPLTISVWARAVRALRAWVAQQGAKQ